MHGFFHHRHCIADRAPRRNQFCRFVVHATAITFIAVRTVVIAFWIGAFPFYVTIGKKALELWIIPLLALSLFKHSVFVNLADKILGKLLVQRKTFRPRR